MSVSGVSDEAIEKLQPILKLTGNTYEKLSNLKNLFESSKMGSKGVEELEYIFDKCKVLQLENNTELDLTLARGLNYYTGAIIEVKALDAEMGSITGGGRYDNLTGIFGLKDISGVGISFGADRIYDVLSDLNLFPENFTHSTDLLFVNFGEKEVEYILPLITKLRSSGIRYELYPEASKMRKQFTYADNNKIPYVAIVGANEIKNSSVTLKDMLSGEQETVSIDELGERFN